MTALALLQQLHTLGVILSPRPDGTVHCRAPKGVLTAELVDAIREHKSALLALAWQSTSAPIWTTPRMEERLDLPPCRRCSGLMRWLNDGPPYRHELGPWFWHCVTCAPPSAH
jgi:hypothetical protein